MYELKASDFADTGQWRLVIKIKKGGLSAFLENTLHPEIELQQMCDVEWEADEKTLCKNIEEAVYENPRLLDDFATKVIIYDRRTLFIPTELAEASAGEEEELYRKVYEAETADIMTDTYKGLTAAWSPGPGVKSFLSRTFPGARVTCNLMEKVKGVLNGGLEKWTDGLREYNEDDETPLWLYEDIRDGEADLILTDGEKLLSASTHEWKKEEDLDNIIQRLKEVYEDNRREIRTQTL